MSRSLTRTGLAPSLCLSALLLLTGCNAMSRLSEVGSEPALSRIDNPVEVVGPEPLVMPMPQPVVPAQQANSLWRQGSRAFFKDQRASEVGDILTVVILIDDSAELTNVSERARDNSEDVGLDNFLGLEAQLDRIFPDEIENENLVGASSTSRSLGSGSVKRDEEINLRVAAVVTQVLPNGNLVIAGRQETRVNYELRQLQVAGIIRPEDIAATNTINFDQIAEARIAYGGRGIISDVQQPRYGQQVFDIIWPF